MLSIDSTFLPATTDTLALRGRIGKRGRTPADLLRSLRPESVEAVADLLRLLARESVERGETERAIATLSDLELHIAGMHDAEELGMLDLRAAIMQVLTALYISRDTQSTAAASAAASTLHLLARQPKRKDTPFLELLGALLFDIACLHSAVGEYRQAEREMEKAIKIFERLAKGNPERYAATVMTALSEATGVYHNRQRQAELLAQYQAATTEYARMVSDGVPEATERLAESLAAEGDTLARMGRHREAIQYYTRALRYVQRVESDFTLRQLRMSMALGESMLKVSAMRDKAVHLLNTMLHKALKINAPAEHQRIGDLLAATKTSSLDILSLWHKIFPK